MRNVGDERTPQGESRGQAELRDTLTDLFREYQPSFERYQWPLESMRWNELAFCILEVWSSELVAQAAARAMSELDLLEVEKLAQLPDVSTGKPSARGQLILGILKEAGFEEAAAEHALINLVEAAKTIRAKMDGKVQQLLRQEGEYMIQKIAGFFGFTALDDEAVHQIITRWLQNVLNLPVYLETESTRVFCAEMNTTVTELVAAADVLDINIAIVDELVQQWYDATMATRSLAAQMSAIDPGAAGPANPGHENQEEQDE